jgi:hypothetical protein
MDDPVFPIAELLLACLCETVAVKPNPPKLCCLRFGTEVAQDIFPQDVCCSGLGYVRVGDMFPSSQSFPNPDDPGQGCVGQAWAVEMELGIFRCADTSDCESCTSGTRQHLIDRWSMVEAVCCFEKRFRKSTHGALSWYPVSGSPLPNEGNCGGATLSVVVQVPGACCVN